MRKSITIFEQTKKDKDGNIICGIRERVIRFDEIIEIVMEMWGQ